MLVVTAGVVTGAGVGVEAGTVLVLRVELLAGAHGAQPSGTVVVEADGGELEDEDTEVFEDDDDEVVDEVMVDEVVVVVVALDEDPQEAPALTEN